MECDHDWDTTHYGLLCVSPLSSLEEICRAYEDKLKKNLKICPRYFWRAKEAFSTLTDDASRETYDETIGLGNKTKMLRFAFCHYHASMSKIVSEMKLEMTAGGLDHGKIRHYQNQINKLKVPDLTKLFEQKKTELSVHEKACIYQDTLNKLGPVDLGALLEYKGLSVPELQHQKVILLMTHAGYKWTNDKVTR